MVAVLKDSGSILDWRLDQRLTSLVMWPWMSPMQITVLGL